MKKIILLSFLVLASPVQAENSIGAFFGAFFGALLGSSASDHSYKHESGRSKKCISGNNCGHEYERLILLPCGKCRMHESCKNSRVHTALNAKKAPTCNCGKSFEYDLAEQRALANSFETKKERYENGKLVRSSDIKVNLGCCGYHMPFSTLEKRIGDAEAAARRSGYEAYITCPKCRDLVPVSRFGIR